MAGGPGKGGKKEIVTPRDRNVTHPLNFSCNFLRLFVSDFDS